MSRRAAVLAALWRDDAGLSLVLIRRGRAGLHAGEMSLPGGRFDAARDEGLLATALRESEEEIGLSPADVRVLGALAERRTYSSDFVVQPFVAQIPAAYPFCVAAGEVAAVGAVPLSELTERRRRVVVRRDFGAGALELPGVSLGWGTVWGLTLDIIEELLRSQHLRALGRQKVRSRLARGPAAR